jgi:hypothetical protein
MTGKEFYTDFFGVKDPKEKGTTINISVWRFAEAYAEALKQGQSLPIDNVSNCECKNLPKGEIAISSIALTDPNWKG